MLLPFELSNLSILECKYNLADNDNCENRYFQIYPYWNVNMA